LAVEVIADILLAITGEHNSHNSRLCNRCSLRYSRSVLREIWQSATFGSLGAVTDAELKLK
jgi:hypothetical protein